MHCEVEKMNLKWKFTLFFTAVFSVIFSITAYASYDRIHSSNQALTHNLSTQLIESKANEAGGWLAQRIRELHTISRTPTVVSMEEEAIKKYVTQLSEDMDDYYGNEYGTFGINDFSGLEYITENQTIDVRDRAYFKEMLVTDKEYIFSEPVISKTDSSMITVACYSIYNPEGKKAGFVAASISLDKLTSITENLSFYDGDTLIMDRSGTLYTHGSNSLPPIILENIKDSIPEEESDQVIVEELGDTYTAFYAPIPGSHDWYLCTVVENSRLFHDTELLTSSLSGLWMAMVLIGIVASFFMSSRITRRVSLLSDAMEEVQKGNLDMTLAVRGKDEISQLSMHFNLMVEEIKRLMREVILTQKEKRQRELQVLQAQINPHFIYNTLDTIQWKALSYGADELSDLIQALSSFFRISLSKGEEKISLSKELAHVRSYLEIQQYRYSDILRYEIEGDENIEGALIPKIIIQPLVENAIYHGIKPKLSGGKIRIAAIRRGEDLILEVCDDGVGIDEETLEKLKEDIKSARPKKSYGLYNVSQRILLYYGKEYGLEIKSRRQKGTCVTISLPYEEEEKNAENNHL